MSTFGLDFVEYEARKFIGKEACIHWLDGNGGSGGMKCVVEKIENGRLHGDYGCSVRVENIAALHPPDECPAKEKEAVA